LKPHHSHLNPSTGPNEFLLYSKEIYKQRLQKLKKLEKLHRPKENLQLSKDEIPNSENTNREAGETSSVK
jgi:hypothetical protein